MIILASNSVWIIASRDLQDALRWVQFPPYSFPSALMAPDDCPSFRFVESVCYVCQLRLRPGRSLQRAIRLWRQPIGRGEHPAVVFGLYPASAYFDGRFSNGPVYAETLADLLNVGPLTHSRSGGNNYAHGKAMTTGTDGFLGLFIQDIDEQVDNFLGTTFDPDALFIVFAGANDLLDGVADINASVGNLTTDINRLINAGAENILVGNLPLLGLTPRFNGDPVQAALMSALTESFNVALGTALDTLESSSPGIDLFRLDVEQLINDAVANPAAFWLANVTDSAAPGLQFDSSGYDPNLIVDEPGTYLFWDDLHPTTAAHALLADFALDAVTYEADFDFDGKVDGFDLAVWQTSYNVDDLADANGDGQSDGLDFLTWQQQKGSGVAALTVLATVPEPNSWAIVLGLVACQFAGYRRSRD